jgi:NAD(P)-dependent dehydrogenase (short-subunit alcohol dehydrogenase family)
MDDCFIHLKGKNIFITGASSGIGEACALRCASLGANIVLIGRNEDRLKKVYELIGPGKHLYFSVDITHYEKIEEIISVCVKKMGKMDGFVHSAGVELTRPIKSMNHTEYEVIYSVNVFAGLEIARLISRRQCCGVSASYIFIASVAGIVGEVGKIAYCGSKAALVASVRSMALELADRDIRVNAISPAVVQTPLTDQMFDRMGDGAKNKIQSKHPLGFGLPVDVANGAAFLLSSAARWITGTNMIIDGGYSAG